VPRVQPQRLGFLFDEFEQKTLSEAIEKWLCKRPLRMVDLEPDGAAPWEMSPRWHVRINARMEAAA
jgi:hypothetical protein